MAGRQCSHERRVTGILQCDLARNASGPSPVYSAQIKLYICASCGNIEFYCESHDDVCVWLGAGGIGDAAVISEASLQFPEEKSLEAEPVAEEE